MLYALGLGYGADPLDPNELAFVYERDQQAVPSQCVVLGHPGFWHREPETGIDWVRLLHGEQFFEIESPLPATGDVVVAHRVAAVDDKGAGKGALLYVESRVSEAGTGKLYATLRSSQFLRGDGGCGSFGIAPAPAMPLPEGEPDRRVTLATLPQAALIYRLSGDLNPLHADPEIANAAGFDRPILQGLCTMGIACRAILSAYCDNRPERLKSLFVRFSKPVYPGETIRFEFFERDGAVLFRAVAMERDAIVLDRCRATFVAQA